MFAVETGKRATHAARALAACGALAFGALILGALALALPTGADAQTQTDAATPASVQLGGEYSGIDSADGWQLVLTPVEVDGRPAFDGQFVDERGQTTGFVAFLEGQGAEAQVAFSNGEAFFKLDPRPAGLTLSWVPIDAEGRLATEASQDFPFIREDLTIPALPEDLASAPSEVTESFSAIAFVKSYEYWTPEQTMRAYASIEPQARTLIRLYAMVHGDILWKLCQSDLEPRLLVEALEGQGVDCRGLLATMSDIQTRGAFGAYKADLAPERSALLDAMRCAAGALRPRDLCVDISRGTSERALSLDNVATILERY